MKKLFLYLSIISLALFLVACNFFPSAPPANSNSGTVNQEVTKTNEELNENNNTEKEEVNIPTNTSEDELALAFQTYLQEIILLAPEETRIIEAYSSVSGNNYQSDAIMYDMLVNEVIPSYADFVRSLENIVPKNREIRDLHDIYIEAATTQLGAFTVMVSALEEGSYELVDLANLGLNEASALISEWQSEVQRLSSITGVKLQ